jgi:hypothetical protein
MKTLLFILCLVAFGYADTTTKIIYQQAVASAASVRSKQIGVNTTADSDLGFKMWFGKDADGNLTQWLAKDKNARMLSVRQDSSFSKFDTSKHYRSPLANFDSSFTTASKATRARATTGIMDSAYVQGLKADRFNLKTLSLDTLKVDSCFRLPQRITDCPVDGSMWYVESHGSIHTWIDGVVSSVNRTLFVQTNTVLDSNSTAETSLIGTSPVHSLDSFPARYFLIGKTHKWYMAGVYSTKSNPAGNLIIKISMNATPLCSVTVALDASEVDQTWSMTGYNTCIDTGTNGNFRLASGFEHTIAGTSHNDRIATPNGGTTVNTTVKLVPKITARFTTADVANKIKSTQFIIEELH